jgi:hypothetical protein
MGINSKSVDGYVEFLVMINKGMSLHGRQVSIAIKRSNC